MLSLGNIQSSFRQAASEHFSRLKNRVSPLRNAFRDAAKNIAAPNANTIRVGIAFLFEEAIPAFCGGIVGFVGGLLTEASPKASILFGVAGTVLCSALYAPIALKHARQLNNEDKTLDQHHPRRNNETAPHDEAQTESMENKL